MAGRIQTVLGPIDPKDAGVTLTHEHISMQFYVSKTPLPDNVKGKISSDLKFEMGNLGFIRQYPYSMHENLKLFEENEAIIEEMKFFKENGGATVVENTTIGIDRDIRLMKRVSEETGVNFVAGAGYYVGPSQKPGVAAMTVEAMHDVIMRDMTEGCDGTDMKCGIIGEIGTSFPLTESEIKCLKAAAKVQSSIGCPVLIHPDRNHRAPFEVFRIFQEAGGDITKTVMAHLDRTIFDHGELLELAKMGSYLEYDLFGTELSYYQKNPALDMPSDAQRIIKIKYLLDEGYEDRIVISHDIHTKHRLMKYGGHGYSHILLNAVPKMLSRGVTQAQMDKILVHNPRNWLTYTC